MADSSSLSNILGLMQLFTGKGSTTTESGGTTTKQTQLSPDIMAQILQKGLEDNQGLAAVVNGQRTAGMYNSTTNTMLTNDLLSRLTTAAAVAGAPTVTNTPVATKTVTTPKLGASGLGVLAGASLFKPEIDKFVGGKGKGGVISSARKALGLDSDAAATADTQAANSVPVADAVSASADAELQASLSNASPSADAMANAAAAGDFTASADYAGVSAVAESAAPAAEAAADWGGSSAGDVADAVADAADSDFVSSLVEDSCFITTAICKYQGKPDNCYELETLRKFRDEWLAGYKPQEIKEYYETAPAIVAKLESMEAASDLFNFLYVGYILPAIDNIERKDNISAYIIYKNMFRFCNAL
jgi:hypothetical protein